MNLPDSVFLSLIKPGQILFFRNPDFPEKPHPHICLGEHGAGVVVMSCGTTKINTIKKYVDIHNLPYSTIVYIEPDTRNNLTEDTYINCNDMPFEFTTDELLNWHKAGQVRTPGEIGAAHLEQIVLGLLESDLIDEWMKDVVRPLLESF